MTAREARRSKDEDLSTEAWIRRQRREVAARTSVSPTAPIDGRVAFMLRRTGNLLGVARSAVDSAVGDAQVIDWGLKTLNLLGRNLSAPGASNIDQLAAAAAAAATYLGDRAAHPEHVLADVKRQLHRADLALNPKASAPAATTDAEVARQLRIGMNQGELGAQVVVAAAGAPGLKVRPLKPYSQEAAYEAHLEQGFAPVQAARLAEPYSGKGHHFIPERAFVTPRQPGVSRPMYWLAHALPKSFKDSAFNVLRPKNMSTGKFYELHYGVDPLSFTNRLPGDREHGAWNGKSLGLQKRGPVGRWFLGMPEPMGWGLLFLGGSSAAGEATGHGHE